MIVLIKKDGMLYAKVMLNLRIAIPYKNIVFGKGKREELLLPEEVEAILMLNGNVQIWNGKKYIKLNLGQFRELVQGKNYIIEEYVEPKPVVKEEPKKVEEPKPVVKEESKPVEEPKPVVKEEPKQQPKKEENKQQYENKKQRHNNNKQQNQGGDK